MMFVMVFTAEHIGTRDDESGHTKTVVATRVRGREHLSVAPNKE